MKSSDILKKVHEGLKCDVITTRLLFDPIAVPLTCLCMRWPWLQPNHLTMAAMVFGILASLCFALDMPLYGGVAYYLCFLLDRMDGTLARAKSCFHPLGKLFDFVADRNSVWLMSVASAYAAWDSGEMHVAVLYMLYVSLFLLKDVWAHEVAACSQAIPANPVEGTSRKTHFKPGQVLSCHLAFLFAPLSSMYRTFMAVALFCVLSSMAVNGLIPLLRLVRKHGIFYRRRGQA